MKNIEKEIKKLKLQLLAEGTISSLTIKIAFIIETVLDVTGVTTTGKIFDFYIEYHNYTPDESLMIRINNRINAYEHY